MNTLNGGTSFKNNHTHKGAHNVSINIKTPTVDDSTVLDPIAIQIKLKASWGTPRRKPINRSCLVNSNDSAKNKPYIKLNIPE